MVKITRKRWDLLVQVKFAYLENRDMSLKKQRYDVAVATDVTEISVQNLYVAMDDFQCHKLVVAGSDPANEEERCVAPINHFGIYHAEILIS
jgi:hypothetical protein